MYSNHELKIVIFEPTSVFTDLGVSGDESGGISGSLGKPGHGR